MDAEMKLELEINQVTAWDLLGGSPALVPVARIASGRVGAYLCRTSAGQYVSTTTDSVSRPLSQAAVGEALDAACDAAGGLGFLLDPRLRDNVQDVAQMRHALVCLGGFGHTGCRQSVGIA